MEILCRNYLSDSYFLKYRVNSPCVLVIKGEFQKANPDVDDAEVTHCCYVLKTNNSDNNDYGVNFDNNVFNNVRLETMYNTGNINRVYYSLSGDGEYKELYLYFMRGRGKYTITTLNKIQDVLYNTEELISYNELIGNLGTTYNAPKSNDVKIPKVDFSSDSSNRNIRTRFVNNLTKETSSQRYTIELKGHSGVYSINPGAGSIMRISLNTYTQPASFLLLKNYDKTNSYKLFDYIGNVYPIINYMTIKDGKFYINLSENKELVAIIEVLINFNGLNLTKEDSFPKGTSISNIIGNAGSFDNKPNNILSGFPYFCKDKKSPEGTSQGIMIYYNGNNWVDSLGRVVDDNYPTLSTGTTSQRPINATTGYQYFDTDLNKPIYWTDSKWVDATGADV